MTTRANKQAQTNATRTRGASPQQLLLLFFLLQSVFEAVNKTYKFLCSKSAHTKVGPDPDHIVLLSRT